MYIVQCTIVHTAYNTQIKKIEHKNDKPAGNDAVHWVVKRVMTAKQIISQTYMIVFCVNVQRRQVSLLKNSPRKLLVNIYCSRFICERVKSCRFLFVWWKHIYSEAYYVTAHREPRSGRNISGRFVPDPPLQTVTIRTTIRWRAL